jgi:hypothetical protein
VASGSTLHTLWLVCGLLLMVQHNHRLIFCCTGNCAVHTSSRTNPQLFSSVDLSCQSTLSLSGVDPHLRSGSSGLCRWRQHEYFMGSAVLECCWCYCRIMPRWHNRLASPTATSFSKLQACCGALCVNATLLASVQVGCYVARCC